ncbi:hypothetical protein [Nakamurella deserti]|uniref:hypothetical protein n=1 Tax=Nakamurella deserti TaxID=2164074 RepID=UPI0014787F07|nr:hypothetical protein [Nakamurella deserti]
MTWQPVLLLGFAGLLLGGVISTWKNDAKVVSAVLAVFTVALTVGGVLWVLGE